MKEVKSFTIDIDGWCRGATMQSQLLTPSGKRCCLGFYLRACGIPDEKLREVLDPKQLAEFGTEVPGWLCCNCPSPFYGPTNSELAASLMDVNDRPVIRLRDRVKQVTELFSEAGIKVRWKKGGKPYRWAGGKGE